MPNTIESIGSLRDAGVSTQATTLFQLMGTTHAIDQRIEETRKLHDQAVELRTPLVNILRATVAAGQKLQATTGSADANGAPTANTAGAANGTGPADLADTKKKYDQLTDAFKAISGVSVPISQEVLLLEQARGNLLSWRAAVDGERGSILRALLLRVLAIALALGVIAVLSEVWRRTTTRYVQDLRTAAAVVDGAAAGDRISNRDRADTRIREPVQFAGDLCRIHHRRACSGSANHSALGGRVLLYRGQVWGACGRPHHGGECNWRCGGGRAGPLLHDGADWNGNGVASDGADRGVRELRALPDGHAAVQADSRDRIRLARSDIEAEAAVGLQDQRQKRCGPR